MNNIKKTQSVQRIMVEKQDSGMSPTSQAAMNMHNSIALLN